MQGIRKNGVPIAILERGRCMSSHLTTYNTRHPHIREAICGNCADMVSLFGGCIRRKGEETAQALMLSMRQVPSAHHRSPCAAHLGRSPAWSSVLIGSLVPNFPPLCPTSGDGLENLAALDVLVVFVKDFERGFLE
jgi:hypothetical protein